MRYRVLGPLEAETDNGPVTLGGQKERLLLALLLTRPNQVVPVEALVEGLWGEQPPSTAAKTLQSHVVRPQGVDLVSKRVHNYQHNRRGASS